MQIVDVEQNTEAWWNARLGIPTASEFGKLLTGTGNPSKQIDAYAAELAAEAFAKKYFGWQGNVHTQRGHELEPDAIAYYELTRGYEIERVGLVLNDTFAGFSHKLAGASPDALVKIPGRGRRPGLLEVKCLSATHHVLAHAYYARHGRPDPAYIAQTQGQMHVCERSWVDLLFYHPDLPELCLRIKRDDAYCSKQVAQINAVAKRRDELLGTLKEAA